MGELPAFDPNHTGLSVQSASRRQPIELGGKETLS